MAGGGGVSRFLPEYSLLKIAVQNSRFCLNIDSLWTNVVHRSSKNLKNLEKSGNFVKTFFLDSVHFDSGKNH